MHEYRFKNELVYTTSTEELQKERDWIIERVYEIGYDKLEKLAKKAKNIRPNAYAPISNYMVGAAILTTGRSVFSGCNREATTLTEGDHAETSAISGAVAAGMTNKLGRKFIDAIAVCHSGDSGPCGRCRQVLLEHSDNCLILSVNPEGKITKVSSLKGLFPYAFGPSHLGIE